jgi:hypothetical protein
MPLLDLLSSSAKRIFYEKDIDQHVRSLGPFRSL